MKTRSAFIHLVSGVILSMAIPIAAGAVDGVLEINQACAISAGCFENDTPGFPVSIDTSGSYRQTGNLDVTGEPDPTTVTAIQVTADHVSIDLNGFSIIGPTVCTLATGGPTLTCSASSFGSGITAGARKGLRVTNGTIRGMGGNGIGAVSTVASHIDGVTVMWNGRVGIQVGGNSILSNNMVVENNSSGIHLSGGSGAVNGNVVSGNGQNGIEAIGSVLINNIVKNNVRRGIQAQSGSTIVANFMTDNGDVGLYLTGPSLGAYGSNTLTGNNGGSANPQVGGFSGTGTEIGTNLCGFDTNCP